jgi:superfamily II DNA/RNA helicase
VDQLLFARYQDHMRIITASVGRSLVQPRQTVLVSATLSPKVLQRASQWVPAQELAYLHTGEEVRVTRVKVADLRTGDSAAAKELSSSSSSSSSSSRSSTAAAAAAPAPDTSGGSSSQAADVPDQQAARQLAAGDAKQGTSAGPSLAAQLLPAGVADTESAAAAFALAPQLRHFYVVTNHNRRVDAVLKCIRALGLKQVLVFVNDNQRRDFARSRMDSSDVPVGVLHGDLSGVEANAMLARFRAGKLRALVVSDVAARGLDFPECDGVVHLELSWRPAQYSHRAGRAGRMGRPGVVLSVITEPQEAEVVQLGRRLGVTMHQAKVANRQFLVKPPKPAAAEEDEE